MDLEFLTLQDLKRGYAETETAYTCMWCGQRYEKGEIHPVAGRLFAADRAVEKHLVEDHPDALDRLIRSDSRYNGLTPHQMELLTLFAAGVTDKEIARRMGVSPSTVRHQKFQFREKAKQARLYLAVFEQVLEGEKRGESMMPIHDSARMVDQRYVITGEERDHVLATAFASLEPLRLRQFSPKEKKKIVILTRIAAEFEAGRTYTEREVNAVLKPIFDDFATLRRYLIEYGFMERSRDGSEYRLL